MVHTKKIIALTFFSILSACSGSGKGSSNHPFGGMCKWNEGVCLNVYSNDVDGSNLQEVCSEMSFVVKAAANNVGIANITPSVISTEEQCSSSNVVSACPIGAEGANLEFKFYSPDFDAQSATVVCSSLRSEEN